MIIYDIRKNIIGNDIHFHLIMELSQYVGKKWSICAEQGDRENGY